MTAYLAEVPEAEAEGLVADLYEDIRQVLGLPLVNLVYRHLAIEPERLAAAWSQLRPNLTDAAVDEAAAELHGAARLELPSLSPAALRALGIGSAALRAVAATLDAYNHANPRNLIGLVALLRGVPGTGAVRPREGSRPAADILPMTGLAGLDQGTLALLLEMAGPFAARGEATLIPGLFRHFAHDRGLLGLFWTTLRPAARGGAIARNGNVVARRAATLVWALPHRVEATQDAETRAVVRRFTETLPRMIAAGRALRRALDEALAADAR
jgi:hypothetical protein